MSTTAGACPFHTTEAQAELSNDFDAFTFLADPHPILTRAREDAPVFFDEATEHWVVTRYDTIKTMLADPETYSSINALDPISPLDERVPETLQAGGFGGRPFIVNLDGEAHGETKRIMAKVLHPRAVAAFEPRIRELAKEMLAELPTNDHSTSSIGSRSSFPRSSSSNFSDSRLTLFARSKAGPMLDSSSSSAAFLATVRLMRPKASSSSGASSTPKPRTPAITSLVTSSG